MIYTSPGYWNTNGKIKGTSKFDARWLYYPLWIAHYTSADQPIVPKPWEDWLFWQYSAKGNGPKYGAESKSIDLNWFNGDLADLFALAGQGEIDPPDQPGIPPDQADLINFKNLQSRLILLEVWARELGLK